MTPWIPFEDSADQYQTAQKEAPDLNLQCPLPTADIGQTASSNETKNILVYLSEMQNLFIRQRKSYME